jgi:hypothetical protein
VLKLTRVKLSSSTKTRVDTYLFCERVKVGGTSSVLPSRYAEANNKYTKFMHHQEKNDTTYVDANNLYGWATCEKLPNGGFKWLDEPEKFDLEN